MTCKINADTTDGLKIVSDTSGEVDIQNNGTTKAAFTANSLVLSGAGTETKSLEIGSGRSGDGITLIDLTGDATYTDFGTRLIRNAGANAATELVHRGTGILALIAQDAGRIEFKVANIEKMRIDADGVTVTDADNSQPRIILKTTDAGASSAFLDFIKDSASPADNDNLMVLRNIGDNDAGETVAYVTLLGRSSDVTDGTENGRFHIETVVDGTNAERFCIDSTGNVGIGASAPTTKLDVAGSMLVDAYNNGGAGNGIFLRGGFLNTQQPSITVADHNGSAPDGLSVNGNDGVSFRTANAERGRFTEGGAFFVGKTTAGNSTQGFEASGTAFRYTAPAGNYLEMNKISGTGTMINFMIGAASKGSISIDASRVYYNTTSDYRLKENVSYTFDATTRLKQLKPCRFSWISDSDSTLQDGFLAHEAKSVIPECVLGEKDATRTAKKVIKKADGTMLEENITEEEWTAGKLAGDYPNDSTWVDKLDVPDYQGIDQSKLVPLLVKTIQELEARITALESE